MIWILRKTADATGENTQDKLEWYRSWPTELLDTPLESSLLPEKAEVQFVRRPQAASVAWRNSEGMQTQ